eukprot:SAG22_NODE_6413_length_859_cov_2.081579_1_plen_158_part_00
MFSTQVTVHAVGTVKLSGHQFWTTKAAGHRPFAFRVGVGGVIKGWDVGCLGMKLGEVRVLDIPSHEAYGAGGFHAWGMLGSSDGGVCRPAGVVGAVLGVVGVLQSAAIVRQRLVGGGSQIIGVISVKCMGGTPLCTILVHPEYLHHCHANTSQAQSA